MVLTSQLHQAAYTNVLQTALRKILQQLAPYLLDSHASLTTLTKRIASLLELGSDAVEEHRTSCPAESLAVMALLQQKP